MKKYNKEHNFRIARMVIEKKKIGYCNFEDQKLKKMKMERRRRYF